MIALPEIREVLTRVARGTWVLLVDFQAFSEPYRQAGVERNADGVLVAFGFLKPALLQSLPWAALLMIPLYEMARRRLTIEHALSLLIIGVWISPFAYLEWHGGFSLNMRYFVSLLPFFAVLGSVGVERLWTNTNVSRRDILSSSVLGIATVGLWIVAIGDANSPRAVAFQLYLPLLIALSLCIAAVAWMALPDTAGLRASFGSVARQLTLTAFVWAGGVSIINTTLISQTVRETLERESKELLAHIPDDALVLTEVMKIVVPLKVSRHRLRVATLENNQYTEILPLVQHHAERGTAIIVYGDESIRLVRATLEGHGYSAETMELVPNGDNLRLLVSLRLHRSSRSSEDTQ
jgi:hypothetical protein